MLRIGFFTLGCKVNQYETAALEQQFAAAGFKIVDASDEAEVYVVNSCTVTSSGDKKSLQTLRKMRRNYPEAVICLTGCFPQAYPDVASEIPEADIIMGAKNRGKLLGAVMDRLNGGERVIDIAEHTVDEKFEKLDSASTSQAVKSSSRTRAFMKIEDGCRRFCAYCIIPTARGPVRSKPLDEIKQELEALATEGCTEVVFAGINLSCYGQDLGLRLLDAVKLACSVDGIERVRLSSLEPELLTREDISAMSSLKKLCPQFHLSLQSGCDATLARMRRHYDTAEYSRIVGDLRAAFENCAITTDVMVGFPGETDDEFAQSLEFCKKIGLAKAHVFAYSQRKGTSAASFPDQISTTVKNERSKKIIAALTETRAQFLHTQIGLPTSVLFENSRTAEGFWQGYSLNYTPVLMYSDENMHKKIVRITPTKVVGDACVV